MNIIFYNIRYIQKSVPPIPQNNRKPHKHKVLGGEQSGQQAGISDEILSKQVKKWSANNF